MHKSLAGVHSFVEYRSLSSQNWPIQNNFGRDTEDRQKKTEAFTGAIAYDRFVDGKVLTQTHKCTLGIFKFTRFYSHRSKSKRRKSTEGKKKK